MPNSSLKPWRSVWLPAAVTAAALVVGVPLFLRMPLWCDLTLYDLAVKNLFDGGVHYRDVFDTNLPGFVWALAAVRAVLGFGSVELRCVDLAMVAGVVFLVDRVARRGGATPSARLWAVAGATVLYLGSVEMVHAQRDVWMALPAIGALLLRLRRASQTDGGTGSAFVCAVLEGILWGAAVWVKPHCALMAVVVWVVTARRVAGASRHPWAAFAADLLGNLVGGAVVGGAGVAYLVGSGAWPHFWEVLTIWAPQYSALACDELDKRLDCALHWFPPWSLWLLPTAILAVLSILDAMPWSARLSVGQPGPVGRRLPEWAWDRDAGPDARFARAALAALFLAWAMQALIIQRQYLYVHVTELFLMLGLWAAHRWAMPAVVIAWLALTSALWLLGDAAPPVRDTLFCVAVHDSRPAPEPDRERYLVRYPLTDPQRLRRWPECWTADAGGPRRLALWDGLARVRGHEAAITWTELDEVAEFLRARGVKDYEVIAWHNSPHAVYQLLGIKPGVRYLHAVTFQGISEEAYRRVHEELAATAGVARYAVSDLASPAEGHVPAWRDCILGPAADPPRDLLPKGLPPAYRVLFPFNQPAVFRSRSGAGRYLVHELRPPLRDWELPHP
jgi:hypothetical protein